MKPTFTARPGQFKAAEIQNAIAQAATGAVRDARDEVLTKGRANIASAGYSKRWQDGLRAEITTGTARGASVDSKVRVFHRYGFATVFETGASISGKPLLWLPLPTIPDRIGARNMTPKNFVKLIGPLFTMRVPGKKPLLGAYMQGLAGSKVTIPKLRRGSALSRLGVRGRGGQAMARKGVVATPVFVGIASIAIRKHWNLTAVYADAQRNLIENYHRRFAEIR